MRYFDITEMSVDEQLLKTLGFKGIFQLGNEVGRFPSGKGKSVAFMSDREAFSRAARSRETLAIVADALPLQKKYLELMREGEKMLIFPVGALTALNSSQLVRGIAQLRAAFSTAKQARVKSAVATLAKTSDYLLSSMQLIEIARLLGNSDEEAKAAVQRLEAFK